MFVVILSVAILTIAMALSTALAVAALTRLVAGYRWPLLAAMLLVALGTVPLSVFGVLLYGRWADYAWVIRGPGMFGDIGGGPYFLAVITFTMAWTTTCWGVAGWLSSDAPRWPRRPRIEPHPHLELVEAAESAIGSARGELRPWGDTPESIAQWVHDNRPG